MRTYDVVFVAAPTMTGEELDAYTAQMKGVVESKGGTVVKVESWGKKPLAYKIGKFREGYYVVLNIQADGAIIAELERRFRVTDTIIRFLSARLDEDLKRSEKLKAARRRKTASRSSPGPGDTQPDSATQAAPA